MIRVRTLVRGGRLGGRPSSSSQCDSCRPSASARAVRMCCSVPSFRAASAL